MDQYVSNTLSWKQRVSAKRYANSDRIPKGRGVFKYAKSAVRRPYKCSGATAYLFGELAEWSKAAVLKTAGGVSHP